MVGSGDKEVTGQARSGGIYCNGWWVGLVTETKIHKETLQPIVSSHPAPTYTRPIAFSNASINSSPKPTSISPSLWPMLCIHHPFGMLQFAGGNPMHSLDRAMPAQAAPGFIQENMCIVVGNHWKL